jgi:CDP-glucose 4,6-dehydratase
MFGDAFRDREVWVTGHTGFKGSWLCGWLLSLGARVHGYALPPPTNPALFEQLALTGRLHHEIGDVRDAGAVRRSLLAVQPDFVFHLAAQALVLKSYQDPAETYATNVMGTVHVLDALRDLTRPCAAVFVTTDKCYENRETGRAYREDDPLGGHDPYSSSKAAAEIAIAAYRRSFFRDHRVRIASARAGNVIGGGDWACDRIVPDCVRALASGTPIAVRNPAATRPWQHVLEPLSGYLWLAACLSPGRTVRPTGRRTAAASDLATAFNFGPSDDANRTVAELVVEFLAHWPGGRWEDRSDPQAAHEAGTLRLSIRKAHRLLGWSPVWDFRTAVAQTAAWYHQTAGWPAAAQAQIARYAADARAKGLTWAGAAVTRLPPSGNA